MKTENDDFVLGIDIGTNSIGWSIVGSHINNQKIINMGSHIFDSVIDKNDIQQGQGETKASERRAARQLRRQIERRRQRKMKVYNILVRHGFLPQGEKDKAINNLDKELKQKYFDNSAKIPAIEHTLPYYLRTRALDEKLEIFELGRAFYHLAQRRGFLSNRKTKKDDKEEGKVKEVISSLAKSINTANARTLGEYFAGIDSEEERIRQRYTSRNMYVNEFNAIWDAQHIYHPNILTDSLKKELFSAIFYQRPLKSVRDLVGNCSLEKDRKRAPYYRPEAQRFRLLQMVNNTDVVIKKTGEVVELTENQRTKLINELEKGDLSFAQSKKLLGFPKGCNFNWELGGEKKFIGERINQKMLEAFGERWWSMKKYERIKAIMDVESIQNHEALRRRGMRYWKLSKESAQKFSEIGLEQGYCNLSIKAINKLLPHMEKGVPYSTARKTEYPDSFFAEQPHDFLPMVTDALPHLRNPIVQRTLNELRKVVNAIIKKYGKPSKITIELGRDLRNSAKQRKAIAKKNRGREQSREDAARKIIAEAGITQPSRDDIEKYLLAEECNWHCPYTNKCISMATLFRDSQFDVEHIIPFSRSLDDSFLNKTLCDRYENQNVKKNRTPYEAYGNNSEKWQEILNRVKRFKLEKGSKNVKLMRFKLEDTEDMDDFCSRQLNDTRYASRIAMDYLGFLYGGRVDSEHNQRVFAGNGRLTSYLRGTWRLNRLLGDNSKKNRADHRHHAIDALVTALLSPNVIQKMSRAAEYADGDHEATWKRLFSKMQPPWPAFLDEAREQVNNIFVSSRVERKVRGKLHEETIYSNKEMVIEGKKYIPLRKELHKLSENEVGKIIDPVIKKAVEEKLAALNEKNPSKAFSDPANHPVLITPKRRGGRTPIHKVHIKSSANPISLGKSVKERRVIPGNNHHIEFFEVLDPKTKEMIKWDAKVISLLDARQRLTDNRPVVNRDHGTNTRFLFSLCNGDCIQLTNSDGKQYLYRVRTITHIKSSGQIQVAFTALQDARILNDIKNYDRDNNIKNEDRGFQLLSPDAFRLRKCQKITITHLGEVRRAND